MLGIGIIKESRTWGWEQQRGAEGQVYGWTEGKLLRVLNTLWAFSDLRRNESKEEKWLRWGGVVKGLGKPPLLYLHICYPSGQDCGTEFCLKKGETKA